MPANRHVLFGHQFRSIAGAAPIVGRAIAVVWGWLPAFLCLVIGTIVGGAVHHLRTTARTWRRVGVVALQEGE